MDWLKKNFVSKYVQVQLIWIGWIRILSGNFNYLRPTMTITVDVDDDDDNLLLLLDHKKNMDHVDWLQLPEDVLSEIAFKFIQVKDVKNLVRFGAVCHSWRSFYIDNRHHLSRKPPLLMLAAHLNQDDQTRSFYNLIEKNIVNFQVPVPHNLFISGSSYGWLVTVSENHEVSLFNPFASSKNEIKLPPLTAFQLGDADDSGLGYRGFLHKVVLSGNPTSNPNYVAMAIYGGCCRLAFYKPGDKAWTSLPRKFCTDDIIYHQDQFYVLSAPGEVFTCDLNNPQSPFTSIVPPLRSVPYKRYLVESYGKLFQVLRHMDYNTDVDAHNYYFNCGFDVFKLNPIKLEWIKVDSLQGRVLFLGCNSSFGISAFDFPGCKPNTIYFTDDHHEGYYEMEEYYGPHDIGVFNIEDRKLEQHYPITSNTVFPAPIWVESV